jgi:hypothetical protein
VDIMTRVIMAVLGTALMLTMLATAFIDWSHARPGLPSSPGMKRFELAPGMSAWQTMFVPACVPERLELQFAEPVTAPGALSVAWFQLDDATRWPSLPVAETSVLLAPGDAHVTIAVPDASRVGARFVGVRLSADRTAIVLPATREEVVPTGFVAGKAGYISRDDLAFRAVYAERRLGAVACIPRTQPALFDQPAMLAGALLVVCFAGAWLSASTARLRQ